MNKFFTKIVLLLCLFLPYTSFAKLEDISHEAFQPYTHAENFSWIAGKLKYLGLEGPTWFIIFSEDNSKKYLLVKSEYIFEPPENIKDGDMVILQGNVKRNQVSTVMTGDYYNVANIELLEPHNELVKKQDEAEALRNQKKQAKKVGG